MATFKVNISLLDELSTAPAERHCHSCKLDIYGWKRSGLIHQCLSCKALMHNSCCNKAKTKACCSNKKMIPAFVTQHNNRSNEWVQIITAIPCSDQNSAPKDAPAAATAKAATDCRALVLHKPPSKEKAPASVPMTGKPSGKAVMSYKTHPILQKVGPGLLPTFHWFCACVPSCLDQGGTCDNPIYTRSAPISIPPSMLKPIATFNPPLLTDKSCAIPGDWTLLCWCEEPCSTHGKDCCDSPIVGGSTSTNDKPLSIITRW